MNENKSINSLKKQLVAAVAMVCVAAVALGSSTYAWFAANSMVTATTGTVNATGEGGIEIKGAHESGWSTAATESLSSGGLRPTSNKGDNVATWYHATATVSSSYAATNSTYQVVSDDTNWADGVVSTGALAGNYYKVANYTIRPTSGSNATALKIDKVTASTSTTNSTLLNKALRVLVKVTDGTNTSFSLYAPLYETATTYNIWDGTSDNGPSVSVTAKATGTASEGVLATIPAAGCTVDVYVFFEGEDENLKSLNYPTVATDALNVTVQFSATVS